MSIEPLHISTTYLDFVTAVEAGIKFPIAFRDRAAMEQWAGTSRLDTKKIGQINKQKSAVLLDGAIPTLQGGSRYYSQVWVRAKYHDYRASILRYLRTSNDFIEGAGIYDADHALSKKRLTTLWPDAWVNLTLVGHSINRSIGAMLEKCPLEVSENETSVFANLEFLLKLTITRTERMSGENLQTYFNEASIRFLHRPNYPAQISMIINANHFLDDIAAQNGLKNCREPLSIVDPH